MYSIDLSKNNAIAEIQEGNTCTVSSISRCVSNKLNYLGINMELDEVKTAEDISRGMGMPDSQILLHGGNLQLVLEQFKTTPFHGTNIKICNLEIISRFNKKKKEWIFNNLKNGKTMCTSMFGSSTTINAQGYATWNYNGASHAMHLDKLNIEDGYIGLDNTLFRKERVRAFNDTFEESCRDIFAFDISIDGVVQNTNPNEPSNIVNELDPTFDYYDIMKKEVPESLRKFNKYEEETSLWKNIKSLIEIYGYRNLKKK